MQKFRSALKDGLEARLEPGKFLADDIADCQLCQMYDDLGSGERYGFWNEIARTIGTDSSWAIKHFRNCFRKS